MKTQIGIVVLGLANFIFDCVDTCLQISAKILPGFVFRPLMSTFDGTKVFAIAMLEASDIRFQVFSTFVEENFPSFHEWLSEKTQNVSNITVEKSNALHLQQVRASAYLSTAFNTWRRRVASASNTVKVHVHPIVHSVAVNSSPVFDGAKRIVSPAVDYFEPVWRPVTSRAIIINESLKHNEIVGEFVVHAEAVVTYFVKEFTEYALADEAPYRANGHSPSSIADDATFEKQQQNKSQQSQQQSQQHNNQQKTANVDKKSAGKDQQQKNTSYTSSSINTTAPSSTSFGGGGGGGGVKSSGAVPRNTSSASSAGGSE